MIAATLASAIVFDILEKTKERTRNVRIAYGILHIMIALLYVFVMGFSRVIIATHAWNQVIFGWLLGIWLATFLELVVRVPLTEQVKLQLHAVDNDNFWRNLIAVMIFMLLVLGMQWIAYGLSTLVGRQADDLDPDTLSIIAKGEELCEGFNKNVAFNNHSLVQTGLSVPFFGALIGLLLQAKIF